VERCFVNAVHSADDLDARHLQGSFWTPEGDRRSSFAFGRNYRNAAQPGRLRAGGGFLGAMALILSGCGGQSVVEIFLDFVGIVHVLFCTRQQIASGSLGLGGGREQRLLIVLQDLDPGRGVARVVVEMGDRQSKFGADERAGNFGYLS